MRDEALKALVLGLIGLASAATANRTIAIYHDGLRTVARELWTGDKTRRELAAFSYSIGMGFIVAYALPYSLATGIIIIHIICLGTDVIGMRFDDVRVAGIVGFLYAAAATLAIDLFVLGIKHLPPIVPDLQLLWQPLGYTFPLLGAAAAARQWGFRWGVSTALFTLLVWGALNGLLHSAGYGGTVFTSGLIALGVTTIALFIAAFRVKAEAPSDPRFFDDKIRRIRGNWYALIPIAALIALAASQRWLGGEPIQVAMLGLGQPHVAALIALFSVLGYIPVQGMTGLVSGVWNQDGYPDWFLGIGYIVSNPVLAAVGGGALMTLEIVSLPIAAKLVTTRPGVTALGHAVRDAMDVVPTLSILAGAVVASLATAGPAGPFVVVGAYALNDVKGRPVTPLAVPVFAYLGVGIVFTVGRRIGLW